MPIPVFKITDFTAPTEESAWLKVRRLEEVFRNAPPLFSAHRHNYYQIYLIISGHGTHFVDLSSFALEPRTLFFISPGQVHTWDLIGQISGWLISFTSEFFAFGLQDKRTLVEMPLFSSENFMPALRLSNEQSATFDDLAHRIEREHHASLLDKEEIMRAYLRVLLIEARRLWAEKATVWRAQAGVKLTRRFLLLVEQQFHSNSSVKKYASLLNVTARHLSETVKETIGQTAGEVIRHRLLLEAKRLLVHTDLTVAEVAYQLGIADPAYFGRFFRRYVHQSPGIFRENTVKSARYLQRES